MLDTMQCPRAALFDVDETLAPSFSPIGDAMTVRLAALLARIPIALVTGRGFDRIGDDFLSAIAASPHAARFFVFTNSGTQCFTRARNTWQSECEYALTDLERARVKTVLEELMKTSAILRDTPHAGEQIIDRKAQIAFTAVGIDAPLEIKTQWDPHGDKRRALIHVLQEQLPDFDMFIGGSSTIDFTKKGFNKSRAVLWLAERLQSAPADMLYVGDGLYDGGNDAVVIPTGIACIQVARIEDTARIIEELIAVCVP